MRKPLLLLLTILLLAACTGTGPTASTTDETMVAETSVTAIVPTAAAEHADDATVTADAEDDHDHDDTLAHTDGLDIDLFFADALAEDPAIQDCTLSDGTETTCYSLTIAGYPADYNVGPFCPPTVESSAEEGGIWFDGSAVYDLDGAFILGLADLYSDDHWKLYDDEGNVNITDTQEKFEAAARPDVDPDLENHCVEGRIEWLDNGEPVPTTVLIPTTPVMADSPTSGGNWGVTLDGVIIAASAPVDAILSAYTIAAFDDCGGHINPFDGYHLHGARGCSEVGEAVEGETPIFAYALDGYAIHSPLDAEAEAAAELDECNGHTTEAYGYHYHANSAEENRVLSCFMGLTVQTQGGGQDGAPAGGQPGAGQPGGAPDFAAAAESLGVTEHQLQDALGGPPPNFAAAAEMLGVSEEALQAALAGDGAPPASTAILTPFQLDAWADNWFAAYLGEELIVEDSVSITTERSFNAETATFEASYPLNLNFILKDFKENDTGLEYIGTSRQQMGDGGFIMQLTDLSTGDVVAVSNETWACTVIHEAPLDKSCENEANPVAGVAPCDFTDLAEPAGWQAAAFDDSSWTDTTVHSASAVSPKDGYNEISWDAGAEFIWGPDLETDNTILCRVTVDAP